MTLYEMKRARLRMLAALSMQRHAGIALPDAPACERDYGEQIFNEQARRFAAAATTGGKRDGS